MNYIINTLYERGSWFTACSLFVTMKVDGKRDDVLKAILFTCDDDEYTIHMTKFMKKM